MGSLGEHGDEVEAAIEELENVTPLLNAALERLVESRSIMATLVGSDDNSNLNPSLSSLADAERSLSAATYEVASGSDHLRAYLLSIGIDAYAMAAAPSL